MQPCTVHDETRHRRESMALSFPIPPLLIMLRHLFHHLRPMPRADFFAVELSDSFQTLSRRLEAMKSYRTLSRKRIALASCVIALLGTVAIVPWRVVAQEAKPVGEKERQAKTATAAEKPKPPKELILGTW